MKTKINTIHDALAFLLQGLYFTETVLKEEFSSCCSQVTSQRIKNEVNQYTGSADDKLLKLERIFNYLMVEPVTRDNDVIRELMSETHRMLAAATSPHLKDVLSIGCIQNINAYKIASYRSAYLFAIELDVDTVADLLEQILEWEIETSNVLTELSIEEFNNTQNPTN